VTRNQEMISALTVSAGASARADWRDLALCRGVDLDVFFPIGSGEGPESTMVQEAKRLCGRCPVQQSCLEWAVRVGAEFGIFGGHTEDERRRLRHSIKRRDHQRRAVARGLAVVQTGEGSSASAPGGPPAGYADLLEPRPY
jgi:WhiB family redox-sensing transcriptional regulator